MKQHLAESLERPFKSEKFEIRVVNCDGTLLTPVNCHALGDLPGFHARSAELPLMARRELYDGVNAKSNKHLDFWALYIVRHGHALHRINDRNFDAARGSVYLMRPGETHLFHEVRNLIVDAFYFGADLFDTTEREILRAMLGAAVLAEETSAVSDEMGGYFLQLSSEQQMKVERIITQIRQDLCVGQTAWDWCARAHFWCLLVQMVQWRAEEKPSLLRINNSLELNEVLTFCAQHFHQAISVEQLCALTFYSHSHFVRLFTSEVGMPPSHYIRHLRLQHAQKLLRETRHPVADVARLSGFGDATAFSRAFKTTMGMKPLEYRRAHK